MTKINQSIASDYAGLSANGRNFYYGYEFDRKNDEEVWGFEYKKNDKPIFRISYEEMQRFDGCPKQFECAECLLFGIGIIMLLDFKPDLT